jgi:hypothetical protein
MELNKQKKYLQSIEIKNKYRIWRPIMNELKYDIICEVGVRTGTNFKLMIESKPTLAVAVDCWCDDGIKSRNDISCTQKELDDQYETFKGEMINNKFVKIFRGYSFDVVKQFSDNFFDLVYIDADHTYEGCFGDINDWYPKVKPGGLLCGDDYVKIAGRTGIKLGVIEATQEFVKINNLHDYFFEFPRNGWGIIKPI